MAYTLQYTLIDNNTHYSVSGYTGTPIDVVIPATYGSKSVTGIGNNAFSKCINLKSIEIPNSVTRIGDYAFYNCTSLKSVVISIIIPESAIRIGDLAFSNCTNLTSITIPNSVTSIGRGAFSKCNKLTSITVESRNTAYKSIDGVLYSKDGKTLIQYPAGKTATVFTIPNSVTSIGDYAFSGCTNLTSITIPNSVTSINYGAFSECSSLTSIEIPNSVTKIGGFAFPKCNKLTSITIPDSVTSIGENAFYFCDNLTNVTIGNSVTSIDEDAFAHCKKLTSVTIGNSVKRIDENAFNNCTNLNSINMISKVPANLSSNSFTNIKSTAKFYCYSSALNSYRTAPNWSSYKDKFVADDMRLAFVASANAQKNYFASKDEIKTLQEQIAGLQEIVNSLQGKIS